MPRELQPCGTNAAYNCHLLRGEQACAACKKAHSEYVLRALRGELPPRVLKPCGTPAAYYRHLYNGEEPCHACRAARALHQRKGRPREGLMPHGTRAAYERHRRAGEKPCEACRIANCRATELAARERSQRPPEEVPHGLSGYLNWGCRCKVCCAAGSARNRKNWENRRRREASGG